MKAILLGAGRGTRLGPITDTVPKILVPLAGRPLLEHQVSYLARNGVTEVIVNVHHLADRVLELLERAELPVPVRVSRERRLLGTAGALAPLGGELAETFVCLYGDVVTDEPLERLLETHRRRGGIATLACYPSTEIEGKGVLALGRADRVTGFVEKPAGLTGSAFVNAGLYALEPGILELIDGPSSFGVDVWPRAIAEGQPVFAHRVGGYVLDVGTPEALRRAERDVEAGVVGGVTRRPAGSASG